MSQYCNTHIRERTDQELANYLKEQLASAKTKTPGGGCEKRCKANAQRAYNVLRERGKVK